MYHAIVRGYERIKFGVENMKKLDKNILLLLSERDQQLYNRTLGVMSV
jgi:hypothetical protein